jgi:hypothetical protein
MQREFHYRILQDTNSERLEKVVGVAILIMFVCPSNGMLALPLRAQACSHFGSKVNVGPWERWKLGF